MLPRVSRTFCFRNPEPWERTKQAATLQILAHWSSHLNAMRIHSASDCSSGTYPSLSATPLSCVARKLLVSRYSFVRVVTWFLEDARPSIKRFATIPPELRTSCAALWSSNFISQVILGMGHNLLRFGVAGLGCCQWPGLIQDYEIWEM